MFFKKKLRISKEERTFSLSKTRQINYVLIRDSFATLRLRVFKKDKQLLIEVKAPKKCTLQYIEDFLHKKAGWMSTKIQEIMEKGEKAGLSFFHEAQFFSLGKPCYFFYKHPCFIKDFPHFQKTVFGKSGLPWECFARLPIASFYEEDFQHTDQNNNLSSTTLLAPSLSDSSILATSTPTFIIPIASQKAYFLVADDIYKIFWEIGEKSHRSFSLKFQQRSQESNDKTALLWIKTKNEDLSVASMYEKNILQYVAYFNENYSQLYEKSILSWRKKTAEQFLAVCFDRVWKGLCGELVESKISLPINIQNYFTSLEKPILKVKHLSKRFGSCARRTRGVLNAHSAEITLAVRLLAFPLSLIEYVIIHECCHLMHMDHSKAFYALMEQCCPSSMQKRELLWEWGYRHAPF